MLREDGKKHGYDVLIQPPVTMEDGTPVSSSVIREKISSGKIREAEELLGHEYEVSGRIPDDAVTTEAEEFPAGCRHGSSSLRAEPTPAW